MRTVLLVLVIACGPAAKPSPTGPIGNTASGGSTAPLSQPSHHAGGSDRDGDGVSDDTDRCPDEPEDFDGFTDEDGCPDPDNDADGILDVDDLCPNVAENRNGNQDDDGCPD